MRARILALLPALVVASVVAAPGTARAALAPTAGPSEPPPARTVVVVSIDGLNPAALRRLGRQRAPVLHRLMRQGASTLNARTAHERTETLPNHTTMVTGRRIDASRGGHGVTWNDDRTTPRTVHDAAGERVASAFTRVDGAGRRTALFVGKTKLSLFERSWPDAVDRSVLREDDRRLVDVVRRDIGRQGRALRFVHLAEPDRAGHEHGFLTAPYLAAVERTDRQLGRIVAKVESRPRRARGTTVVVTSDHGGTGLRHHEADRWANYRVPFVVWGSGVAAGSDLYDLNPDYRDPGRRRTTYAAQRPPVRNGDVANLVTRLLGLRPVPGSEVGRAQVLDVR
ncbi:alkaline phosphatase family protein [Nocardioides sp. GCM10027113]|uniref:alkaline phosphatase family protein n=1 Tax=unclassified Nocardioides TaxID=2615069 RepID=UPI003617AD31